jgi:Ohr subfamily peroxiredoxin
MYLLAIRTRNIAIRTGAHRTHPYVWCFYVDPIATLVLAGKRVRRIDKPSAVYRHPPRSNNMKLDKIIYTGKTHTSSGGRNGTSLSSDGRLDIRLSSPGAAGDGTNPEQLFAAGWSACFIGAMGLAAKGLNITLPDALSVDAEVDLGMIDGGYALQARLNVHLPGLDSKMARTLVDKAHETCPYSKATRGNIDVQINLI